MISPNSPPSSPVRKSFQCFSVQYSENSPCLCGAGIEKVLSFKFVSFKLKRKVLSPKPLPAAPVNPENPVILSKKVLSFKLLRKSLQFFGLFSVSLWLCERRSFKFEVAEEEIFKPQ